MIDDAFKKEIEALCRVFEETEVFKVGISEKAKERLESEAKQFRRIKPFKESLRFHDDAVYLIATIEGYERMLYITVDSGRAPKVFKEGSVVKLDGYTIYITEFNPKNLRRLIAEKPELGPKSLGNTPRLGLGVRMLFTLPAFVEALKKFRILVDFQLSAGREFSLKEVINAPPGVYPEWLGHTGLDAETLYNVIALECFKHGAEVYGTEIDHLIVTGQPDKALARILMHGRHMVEESLVGLETSMKYNFRIIDEATATGFVKGITVDSSDLIRYDFMSREKWPNEAIRRRFKEEFRDEADEVLKTVKPGALHRFNGFELTFTEEEAMRIALKYRLCLLKARELYEYFKSKIDGGFTYELSLDETPELTDPKELLYCLLECSRMGMPIDLVAPNVGFHKREDYQGSLEELEERVRALSAIADRFGAILDFHSGSDKRAEVYHVISRACRGRLKLKMSTIYQLKFFETLAEFPEDSEERRLFEEIWDYTLNYVKRRSSQGDEVARKQLEEVLKRMGEPGFVKSHEDDFFRYYSFIVVNAKRPDGSRLFKERLYETASKEEVYERFRKKVLEVTKTVAEALGLTSSKLLNLS